MLGDDTELVYGPALPALGGGGDGWMDGWISPFARHWDIQPNLDDTSALCIEIPTGHHLPVKRFLLYTT